MPPRRHQHAKARASATAASEAVTDADVAFMRRALDLAQRGVGHTEPNPAVGCVIVAGGDEVVGEGYHPKAGEPHAEVRLRCCLLRLTEVRWVTAFK